MEASDHKIGSPTDEILLFCYHYDPSSGKYTLAVMALLRATAIAVLILLGGGLFLLWRRDVRADGRAQREMALR